MSALASKQSLRDTNPTSAARVIKVSVRERNQSSKQQTNHSIPISTNSQRKLNSVPPNTKKTDLNLLANAYSATNKSTKSIISNEFKQKKSGKRSKNLHHFRKLQGISPLDAHNITNEFSHKSIPMNKNKCLSIFRRPYSWICIFGMIIILLFVCTAIAAILVGTLIKNPSTTSITQITTSGSTNGLANPCTSGIYWNVTGTIYAGTSTGIPGSGLHEFSTPSSLYIDSNDNLYIGDSSNRRVMKYTPGASSGTIVAGTGTSGAGLNQTSSNGLRYIYVDSSQNIYMSDYTNNRVVRWANGASTGVIVAGSGTPGAALNQLHAPTGVWVDSNSNVYVAEYSNERVTKWSPGATVGIVVAGNTSQSGGSTDQLSAPAGLYFDETNQDLYIVNAFGNGATVMKWRIGSYHGTVVGGVSGFPGSNSTQLFNPMGVTVDRWRNVYVTDLGGAYVKLFCNGIREGIRIVGSGTGGTSTSSPYDVKLDSQMNLYVVLRNGNRVLKFAKL